jgi:hypothetical protein
MAVGAAAVAAFALLGAVVVVAVGLGLGLGPAIQWWGTADGKAPRYVLPLTALFLALGVAALGLTAGSPVDTDNVSAYQALVAAYYGLMLVYVGLMAAVRYAAVKPVLVVAGAVQLTATGFLAAVAFGTSDDLISVAFVLQLAASLWAALYDAIYYPVPGTKAPGSGYSVLGSSL